MKLKIVNTLHTYCCLQLVDLFLMGHKGPKGLKCCPTTIAKFWLLPFPLAFCSGLGLGLGLNLSNRGLSMKDSDMTLEWVVFTNGFLAQRALDITLLRSVRYNEVTWYVSEKSSGAQLTIASLKKKSLIRTSFSLKNLSHTCILKDTSPQALLSY